ncbi:MAG: ABC transporter permease [Clostridiales Family XIII bacterium]|jgi:ribose transport system permease protein/rhamnose transport system permease protein|nr:ABC transporter permease [Clostridiales Family XIII bacterium]
MDGNTQTLSKPKRKFGVNFNVALILILIALIAIIGAVNPTFLTYNYMMSVVVKNIMEIGLMALPMTLIVITAGIDLSVGSTMIFSAIAGGMAAASMGEGAGILVTLLVGAACGLANGLIIVKLKINALITTLATFFLFRGIAKGITHGDSVYSYEFTTYVGNKDIAGIPLVLIVFIAAAVIFTLLLSKTGFGRSLYALGLNENATRYSGINADRTLIGIYVISGVVCAIAAYFYLGRFTSVKFDVANSMNLKVVTVIVLGGTSILGGVGDMKGTIIAIFIIAVLNSGLTVMDIPIDVQTIIQGTVLIISLIVYSILGERAKRRRIIEVGKGGEPRLAGQAPA